MTADDAPTDLVGTAGSNQLRLALEQQDDAAVLVASGEIDMVTAPRFQQELLAAVHERPSALIVDLTDVEFFASAGLSALVAAYQQAGTDTVVRVVAPTSATARPLQITALDRKIPVHESRIDALQRK
ncbi:STAS domain-containing protein [Saccharopolyspora sp. NFXS83]|uniref:STAS domain-containing protein n=1 Tax=Saccharopolyspora sp. NFXS83 TaxID=2993560 RepID=UPI00224A8B54|nr:STAS domain-containing protein [Saccharopolyspora sp. NFXS83]MCX2729257.1 STAS domain-containing protein [Saccharopolyspora sp. NFXS83]